MRTNGHNTKAIAILIHQAIQGLSRETPNPNALIELLKLSPEDLPATEDLFVEVAASLPKPTQESFTTMLAGVLVPSDTSEDLALVAGRAVAMVEERKLTEAILGPSQFVTEPLEETGRVMRWKAALANCLSRAAQCVVIKRPGQALELAGAKEDVALIKYLFTFLATEVDKIAGIEAAGQSRSQVLAYRLEIVEVIAVAVNDAQAALLAKLKAIDPETLLRALATLEPRVREIETFARMSVLTKRRKSPSPFTSRRPSVLPDPKDK